MSVRGRPCKTNSPDSSEPETKTRQKQAPQPRCSAAEKTNGTRRRANKQDQQKEKQQEKSCVEMRAKNADCVAEEAGNPTAGSAVQICQATTKTTKKSAKPKQEDHNSVEGKKKSPEMKKPNRIKSPERPREETVKKKGDSILKETVKKKDDVILKETLKILKIKMEERSNVAKEINDIKKHLTNHLKEKTQLFKEVQEPLNTGSYYENLKISNPDEFDVMLPLLVERAKPEPFKEDGAFYKVALQRENNPLKDLQKDGFLPASQILAEFRKEVKKLLKNVEEWKMVQAKPGCPAVTLTKTVGSIPVSLDLVLCLQVKSSWPPFTTDGFKIEGWLGAKTKQEHKRKPYYLVPKYEGKGSVEHNGVASKDAWRISFSHIEKEILKNHGSAKTCCERGKTV
ncbi:cyclic GMP-AMP synthase isoform X2 [Oryzias latipes]|uniref:cyclic GMP-AMP synthase isoform X2 n=1 Tax=Oryzias latipes TaxID=8090 RepID=UPI0009DAADF7|nr:cyclic GMP-AMP synthase isoform X2 [Oryzias latipes]